jgi:hypothetical protein
MGKNDINSIELFINKNSPYFSRINLINSKHIRYQNLRKRRIYEKAYIPEFNRYCKEVKYNGR